MPGGIIAASRGAGTFHNFTKTLSKENKRDRRCPAPHGGKAGENKRPLRCGIALEPVEPVPCPMSQSHLGGPGNMPACYWTAGVGQNEANGDENAKCAGGGEGWG